LPVWLEPEPFKRQPIRVFRNDNGSRGHLLNSIAHLSAPMRPPDQSQRPQSFSNHITPKS
jgi:hypothetical protein